MATHNWEGNALDPEVYSIARAQMLTKARQKWNELDNTDTVRYDDAMLLLS